MKAQQVLILCIVQIAACVVTRADDEAPSTNCDEYAAVKTGSSHGVRFEEINPKIAIPACENAVRQYPNSTRLIFELGRSYLKNGDYDAALRQFQIAAAQGYAPALNGIGTMYFSGYGVPQNDGKAVIWYRKAAEQGYVGGQINLGFSYENGRGIPQDYGEALKWYRKAADQGSMLAQDSVGYFYTNGLGVKRDDAEAVIWFRKAAIQGMAGAQYNVGTMYEHGFGVPEDRAQAVAWFRKAADQGNEGAKKKLIALDAEEKAHASNPPTITRLKMQAVTSCPFPSESDIENCYEESLKAFRGHPQDLMKEDVRDAVAYCYHIPSSNDGQLCNDLHDHFSALFAEEAQEQIESAARERRQREAEEAKKPRFVTVTARGVSVVPGAIVCPDYNTVNLMFELYATHWADTYQDVLSNGQSRLLRGRPAPAPDPKFYGCALVPPGTPMILERRNIVPVVTVKLADGTTIRGVTSPAMFVGQ
jgi:TPR repeat protein